jgi:hypothetical protein
VCFSLIPPGIIIIKKRGTKYKETKIEGGFLLYISHTHTHTDSMVICQLDEKGGKLLLMTYSIRNFHLSRPV